MCQQALPAAGVRTRAAGHGPSLHPNAGEAAQRPGVEGHRGGFRGRGRGGSLLPLSLRHQGREGLLLLPPPQPPPEQPAGGARPGGKSQGMVKAVQRSRGRRRRGAASVF